MSDKYNIGLKVMIQAFTMFGCMYAGLEVTGDRRSRLQNNVKNAIAFTAFLAGLLLAWLESCMPYASFFSTEMLVVLLVIVLAEMQCKVIKTMLLPQNKTIPVLFTAYITALMYMANIRSAYAECSAAAVTEDDWTNHPNEDNTFKNYTYTAATDTAPAQWSITVTATQKSTSNGTEGWANGKPNIGGTSVAAKTDSYTVTVKADGTCEVK